MLRCASRATERNDTLHHSGIARSPLESLSRDEHSPRFPLSYLARSHRPADDSKDLRAPEMLRDELVLRPNVLLKCQIASLFRREKGS